MGMREEDSLTTVILQHEGPALIAKWSKHLPLPSAVFQSSLEGLHYLALYSILQSSVEGLQCWMCLVLSILRILISQSKEEVVLSRLQELSLGINVFTDTLERHGAARTGGSLSSGSPRPKDELSPEETVARWGNYWQTCWGGGYSIVWSLK